MSYSDEFKCILEKRNSILNTNMIIFKNSKPKELKIFPIEIKDSILSHYFSYLSHATEENEFVDFIPNKKETGTLQVISTEYLSRWQEILEVWNGHLDINVDKMVVNDYNCDGNTILMDIEFEDERHVYFLTRYRNVSSWYSNNVRFTKKSNGKFREEKGDILALTPCVDAVIDNQRCYIINEGNFSVIFNFDEVIKNQIKENEQELRDMNFIGDSESFMKFLGKSKRQRSAMAKVLMQKRLDKIKKFKPEYIRKQIEDQPGLSFIRYTDDDKIIVDNKKSFNAVVGILCGTINLDLITKELNGIDEYA